MKLDDIDAVIEANTGDFRAAQASHNSTYGRYWQGPVTHATVPITTALPRNQDVALSISGLTWRDMLPALSDTRLPFRAVCDEYETTNGRGYRVVIEATMSGQTWSKTIDFGDNANTINWHVTTDIGS